MLLFVRTLDFFSTHNFDIVQCKNWKHEHCRTFRHFALVINLTFACPAYRMQAQARILDFDID